MNTLKWICGSLLLCLLAAACASAPTPQASEQPYPSPEETPLTTASPTPSPQAEPSLTSTPSGAWISLTPGAGGPGAAVQIDGYLPGGPPARAMKDNNHVTYADLCWGGCQNGLMEDGLEVAWSVEEPGYFHLEFLVPEIPWLAADGLHPLKPGDYIVSILNLDPNAVGCSPSAASEQGCPVTPQASATFHLREGYSGPECQEASACGYLKATPAHGAPGDIIQVQGWAPLLQIIGQPYGYDLVLEIQASSLPQNLIYLARQPGEVVQQELDGSLTASFQVPQYVGGAALNPGSYILALQAGGLTSGKNAPGVLVAPTAFEISAAPAWTQLQRPAPLWIQPSASLDSVFSLDALDPHRLAYCIEGAIQLSQDGGESWESIPTGPVNDLALPGGLVMDNPQPVCASVLLDASHPDSFYAIFGGMNKQYGVPPAYFLPFYTSDRGKTWQLVPIPAVQTISSMVEGRFNGFWTDGNVVQALYSGDFNSATRQSLLLVKQTKDGGLTWEPASLICPSWGPCLRWGAAPGQISGMGSNLPQALLASFDGGQTWSATNETVELRLSDPRQLAALSPEEALIISGGERYPLRYTPDGGRTWQALGLPPLPGASRDWQNGFPGLQMPPDGSFLALNPDTGAWWELPSNTQEWCPLEIASPNKYPVLLQSAGGWVWWFSARTGKPESAPASSLVCTP